VVLLGKAPERHQGRLEHERAHHRALHRLVRQADDVAHLVLQVSQRAYRSSDRVPGSAGAIADILPRAGLPAGVVNLLMGRGSEVGQVLLDDQRVNAISFTGSVATGQRIAQACVARMAKFQLEMGGKNPTVVLADADLDYAASILVNSAQSNSPAASEPDEQPLFTVTYAEPLQLIRPNRSIWLLLYAATIACYQRQCRASLGLCRSRAHSAEVCDHV